MWYLRIFWTFILIILMVFAGVASIILFIASLVGEYQPYVDGPDSITLMLVAIVFRMLISENMEKL